MESVVISGVSKRFRLYHERASTLKERVIDWRKPKYEEFWALQDVSFSIPQGTTAGLIGPNGSGKSTLLKLIAGIMRPDSGSIQTRGRIASLLELGAGFHPDLTGRENVYMNASILGLTRKQTDRYFDSIVAFSELERFIDMQVRHYSSGMYVRLGFAVAVHVDPDILIVDEVLAVGDEAFQRRCMERISTFQQEGRTIVFVTHAVDTARALCDRVYLLTTGRLAVEGDPAEAIKAYRDILHGEAHLETAPEQERGDRRVRIESVTFLGEASTPQQVFRPGAPLGVRVDLASDQPVDDPIVWMSIHDSKGHRLFGTSTEVQNMSFGPVDGHLSLMFNIEMLTLMEGDYKVSVGVHQRGGEVVYHWRERAFAFRVVKDGMEEGSVFMPVRISVEQVPV